GRLPEDRTEAADEMGFGDVRHRGDRSDVQWFGVGAIHGVAGAQEAPVEILDLPAHGATLDTESSLSGVAGECNLVASGTGPIRLLAACARIIATEAIAHATIAATINQSVSAMALAVGWTPGAAAWVRNTLPNVATPSTRPNWMTVVSTPLASAASSGATFDKATVRIG